MNSTRNRSKRPPLQTWRSKRTPANWQGRRAEARRCVRNQRQRGQSAPPLLARKPDAQRSRVVNAINATAGSAMFPSLLRMPDGLRRGRRGLRRACQDERTPRTRRRIASAPHDGRRRREPRGRPQDLLLNAPSERERHSAVIVPLGRSGLGAGKRGARDTARRRCFLARECSDMRHLAVLGAAYVLHAGLVPGCRELRETDRGNQRCREQPGRHRPRQGSRETVTICTPTHSRPISNYAAAAGLSRSERPPGLHENDTESTNKRPSDDGLTTADDHVLDRQA